MIGQGEVNFLSCGMRLPFLFLACFLSVSAHAGSCQFVWSLSGLGMNLGQAVDQVDYEPDRIKVHSVFSVNQGLAFLGVKNVQISFEIEPQAGKVTTQELHVAKKESRVEWLVDKTTYTKKTGGVVEKVFELPAVKGPSMDSTMFPYSIWMGLLKPNDTSIRVLNKTAPYEAQIAYKKTNSGAELIFKNEHKEGWVQLDAQQMPTAFTFYDGSKTAKAVLASKTCR